MPTLVLCGAEDRITPPALSTALTRLIPGAQYDAIEGAGHLSNLEQPDAFNTARPRLHPRRGFAGVI